MDEQLVEEIAGFLAQRYALIPVEGARDIDRETARAIIALCKEEEGFSQRFWGGLRDRESLVGTGQEEKDGD